uniref:GDT1 family protein n=1 Tax=Eucampia antarctica TaxID=49252 RepID=A0A7S2RTQ3_9STRA|mmetsp:Transcript_26600/g.25467  ORF Transcript_26600/g.25467 Transcript_26600/m.25467 type:complete len:226 (+) Transcript_26600:24-701(+)|eukprot:CAMPEP_0197824864 /NCGR_PEP_ID=MMETSP1437-20131217/2075_1 /TAXON_ID=49252 ORGANISM="Eucampia antarctica, Strain CCMP1452" /NCGR_SAMPLE_ID=MMETSP1437 /ASSEMBLY_ACC=CAM_ASM_001096 /LENGTH=225 /DNA_ID=CAMNT_0043424665 /DNA_START=24 /DNA_END=701 /DNA_ORIENTATION=-
MMKNSILTLFLAVICLVAQTALSFTVPLSQKNSLSNVPAVGRAISNNNNNNNDLSLSSTFGVVSVSSSSSLSSSGTELRAADLDVVSLVVGQENYGLAIVAVGEAVWSFLSAPSFDHAKVLVPAVVTAAILVLVSGPMIVGDAHSAESIATGLEIATVASVALGLSYVARLVAPYSPSPKEIAFGGLLVSLAGFFSFSQNLIVDGFITLPSLPPLPTLPSIQLPF